MNLMKSMAMVTVLILTTGSAGFTVGQSITDSLDGVTLSETQTFAGGPCTFSFTAPGGELADNDINIFVLTMSPDILEITSIELEITGLSHFIPDDLDIFLIDPSLTNDYILVMNDRGNGFDLSQENPVNLLFSDLATQVLPDETQIVSGTYRPQGLAEGIDLGMGNYIGVSGGGPQPWLLVVIDDAAEDVGSFESFTLRGTYVPEPATLSLLAFGALAILHRRRR